MLCNKLLSISYKLPVFYFKIVFDNNDDDDVDDDDNNNNDFDYYCK